ncbi:MerR family transcriptional regulator [Microbacterium hominis]|uniref:MerR family transcriptional regulator n=1 Tax=Microbacterium TaxID=33882 RepID=UPI00168C0141|nr:MULTISPECIES: MerR family transcriptional regulator [Microbacterium]QOC26686.1 MerR family transcriptional regulator [Microbacterium hominis]QOC27861.1 MerR family transcriptional regulator [Microbacterium hominis]QYF96986.1 MerR family transcriptional regulator [Microbacterium sp. PAMC21962]
MTTMLTMGEAVAASGLSADTLRYYEDEGIIGPLTRDHRNHRVFSDNDLAWIGVVTCMKDAGLGIDDLRTFADLLHGPHAAVDPVAFLEERRRVLSRAITVMDDKIAHFRRSRDRAGSPDAG